MKKILLIAVLSASLAACGTTAQTTITSIEAFAANVVVQVRAQCSWIEPASNVIQMIINAGGVGAVSISGLVALICGTVDSAGSLRARSSRLIYGVPLQGHRR